MKKIDEIEYKKILLDELEFFHEFCKANNLKYYLFYGSLIGAMRHGGFIPWDDDLDVIMFRDDYDRLCELFNDNNSRYELVSIETRNDFTAPLAKIIDKKTKLVQNYGLKENVELGVYIDVFVLDNLPDNENERKKSYEQARKLSRYWLVANHEFKYEGDSFIKCLLRYIKYLKAHIHGEKYYLSQIDYHAKKYNKVETRYVGVLSYVFPWGKDEIFKKDDFNLKEVKFENLQCYVPENYDSILTRLYGDWRQLPPVEKRQSHHSYECYWRGN